MREQGPILVPLDGSDLAEGALPYAAALARAVGAKLVLVTAWEGVEREFGSSFPTLNADVEQQAQSHFGQYLAAARQRAGADIVGDVLIRHGEAPQGVLRAAEETGARAIAMASHGRSGIGRWMYGSTAGHILRESSVPVLVAGPHAIERPSAGVAYKRILVPLDGSPLSEQALPVATGIAAAAGASICLARVVRWAVEAYPYTLPQAYTPQIDEELQEGAKAYLRRQEAAVKGPSVEAFVIRGAPADSLIEFVDKESIDLVVMTTHAREGIARAALGSVADRMLQANAPILLISPPAA